MAVAKVTLNGTTIMDNTDATASANEILSPYTAYIATGVKATGTATSGSGSRQEKTGTVTGDGTVVLQMPCSFAPDIIYVYGDLSGDPSLRGVVAWSLVKDMDIYMASDTSTSGTTDSVVYGNHGISGYNESDPTSPHASYSNGTLTIDNVSNTSSYRFANGITYSYTLVAYGEGGGGGATQHEIHLEFTDSTDTDIDVYYDDPLISTMITSYDPVTYGQKTVDSAALDNVVWYTRPTVTWETVWEGTADSISDTPYNYFWISALGDVYPSVGEVWRITVNGTPYICTAYVLPMQWLTTVGLGNPKYSGGADDGSDAPFNFYNAGYGAMTGDTDLTGGFTFSFKFERQISA